MDTQSPGATPPRVCAVSFLNTVPLVWGMLHGPQKSCFDLSFSTPSECARRLVANEADIGIAPAVEVMRNGFEIIPGQGIASRGAVRSILLITKVDPHKIRTLAADASSRSSIVLAQIVLARRYGAEPRLTSMPPYLPEMLRTCDAALIIGDPALRLNPRHLPYASLDLGAEWFELTGLPMVFAVWACRRGFAATPELAAAFAGSSRFGLENLEEIVRRESAARRFPEPLTRDYLTRHIVSELGGEEYAGMRLFLQYAKEFDTVVSVGGATVS